MPRASAQDIAFDPYGKGVTKLAVLDYLYRTFPDVQIASSMTSSEVRKLACDRIQQINRSNRKKSTRGSATKKAEETGPTQSSRKQTKNKRSTKAKTAPSVDQTCKTQPVVQPATRSQSTPLHTFKTTARKKLLGPSDSETQLRKRSSTTSKSRDIPSVSFSDAPRTISKSAKSKITKGNKAHVVQPHHENSLEIDELESSNNEEQEEDDRGEEEYEDENEGEENDQHEDEDEEVKIPQYEVMYSESEHERDPPVPPVPPINTPRPIHQYLAPKQAKTSTHPPASRSIPTLPTTTGVPKRAAAHAGLQERQRSSQSHTVPQRGAHSNQSEENNSHDAWPKQVTINHTQSLANVIPPQPNRHSPTPQDSNHFQSAIGHGVLPKRVKKSHRPVEPIQINKLAASSSSSAIVPPVQSMQSLPLDNTLTNLYSGQKQQLSLEDCLKLSKFLGEQLNSLQHESSSTQSTVPQVTVTPPTNYQQTPNASTTHQQSSNGYPRHQEFSHTPANDPPNSHRSDQHIYTASTNLQQSSNAYATHQQSSNDRMNDHQFSNASTNSQQTRNTHLSYPQFSCAVSNDQSSNASTSHQQTSNTYVSQQQTSNIDPSQEQISNVYDLSHQQNRNPSTNNQETSKANATDISRSTQIHLQEGLLKDQQPVNIWLTQSSDLQNEDLLDNMLLHIEEREEKKARWDMIYNLHPFDWMPLTDTKIELPPPPEPTTPAPAPPPPEPSWIRLTDFNEVKKSPEEPDDSSSQPNDLGAIEVVDTDNRTTSTTPATERGGKASSPPRSPLLLMEALLAMHHDTLNLMKQSQYYPQDFRTTSAAPVTNNPTVPSLLVTQPCQDAPSGQLTKPIIDSAKTSSMANPGTLEKSQSEATTAAVMQPPLTAIKQNIEIPKTSQALQACTNLVSDTSAKKSSLFGFQKSKIGTNEHKPPSELPASSCGIKSIPPTTCLTVAPKETRLIAKLPSQPSQTEILSNISLPNLTSEPSGLTPKVVNTEGGLLNPEVLSSDVSSRETVVQVSGKVASVRENLGEDNHVLPTNQSPNLQIVQGKDALSTIRALAQNAKLQPHNDGALSDTNLLNSKSSASTLKDKPDCLTQKVPESKFDATPSTGQTQATDSTDSDRITQAADSMQAVLLLNPEVHNLKEENPNSSITVSLSDSTLDKSHHTSTIGAGNDTSPTNLAPDQNTVQEKFVPFMFLAPDQNTSQNMQDVPLIQTTSSTDHTQAADSTGADHITQDSTQAGLLLNPKVHTLKENSNRSITVSLSDATHDNYHHIGTKGAENIMSTNLAPDRNPIQEKDVPSTFLATDQNISEDMQEVPPIQVTSTLLPPSKNSQSTSAEHLNSPSENKRQINLMIKKEKKKLKDNSNKFKNIKQNLFSIGRTESESKSESDDKTSSSSSCSSNELSRTRQNQKESSTLEPKVNRDELELALNELVIECD